MRIGIIGGGIAGLTSAWLLQREAHEIVLFERQSTIGMDMHSVEISNDSQTQRIDVPSRMFNRLEWPQLTKLYELLGVDTTAINTSQSFCKLDGECYLNLDVAQRPGIWDALMMRSETRSLLQEAKRFQNQGRQFLKANTDHAPSFGEFLSSNGFSTAFADDFLFPTLSSTVCTCSYDNVKRIPASIILATLRNLYDDSSLFRTRNGTIDVVERLSKSGFEIRLGCDVARVDTENQTAIVKGSNFEAEQFDRIIIATQANHAATLAKNDKMLVEALSQFEYDDVNVVVHRDKSLMPNDRKHWATFNMTSTKKQTAMCSVWLNKFYESLESTDDVFQTINPISNPDSIVCQSSMQRPLATASSVTAKQALDQMQRNPDRLVRVCGSYAGNGIPLLESAVASSLQVVTEMGVKTPDVFAAGE